MAEVAFPGPPPVRQTDTQVQAWGQLPRPGRGQTLARGDPGPGRVLEGESRHAGRASWTPACPHPLSQRTRQASREAPGPATRCPEVVMGLRLSPGSAPVPFPRLQPGAPRGWDGGCCSRSPDSSPSWGPGAPPIASNCERRWGLGGWPLCSPCPTGPQGPQAGAALTCPEWLPSLETKPTLNRSTGLGTPSQNTRAES